MKKKRDTPPPKRGIVVFVEGETEKVFYEAIIKHLRELNPEKQCVKVIVKNVKGVGNYGSKAPRKFKNEILPKHPEVDFTVICCYDADRFKYDAKPPVKWKVVEKEIKSYGAVKVLHIIAEDMMEDWFLIDLQGLCEYLGISEMPTLKGNNGEEKMKYLFRKVNKIYIKGSYCHEFVDKINLELIINVRKSELEKLQQNLFY